MELPGGGHGWRYEDELVPLSQSIVRLRDETTRGERPNGMAYFEEMRPGCYQPHARLEDMDIDGVWASHPFDNFNVSVPEPLGAAVLLVAGPIMLSRRRR